MNMNTDSVPLVDGVSFEISVNFERWKHSEAALLYASPCPEEMMRGLCDRAHDDFTTLIATPAQASGDVMLKLLPLLVSIFEPRLGDPPLVPRVDTDSHTFSDGEREALEVLVSDLRRLSAPIASAMTIPHPKNHGVADA